MTTANETNDTGRKDPVALFARTRKSYPISTTVPWLLASKVMAPARTPSYFERPRLLERIERDRWPILEVRAPGGFGKTTLLAEVCRRERQRGRLAAWLTLDEDDTEDGVGMYLMYAFERAGLDLAVAPDAVEYRMELLAQEIENHGAPCLLVIDELERLGGHAVEAVDFFLHHAPGNLRFVLGLRDNPGLDLSSAVLEGRAIVIGADRLRFSRPEIAGFFGGLLSRRELAAVAERTEGWPVAVCLYRNARLDEAGTSRSERRVRFLSGDERITANWLGARFLRNLADDERAFLLDLALFDRIDPPLVDEVLDRTDSGRRLAALTALEGLMQPLGSAADTRCLHPLLKDYCAAERRREDPERYRQLHRAIAMAMLERRHLVPAMRHAGETGDPELVGSILERAGGLRLWLREGMTRLGAAERFLTEAVIERFPRLALLRCRMLIHRSKLMDARALYETVRAGTDDFAQDRTGGDDRAFRAEGLIVRAALIGYGCLPYGNELFEDLGASLEDVKGEDEPDPAIVACHAALLFAAHHQRARFERGFEFAAEAETQYRLCDSPNGHYHVALHLGIVAMAQGRVADAEACYARAARIAEQHFPLHPPMARTVEILLAELNLERDNMEFVHRWASAIQLPLRNPVAWLDIYVAAYEAGAQWRFEIGGAEDALLSIETWRDAAELEGLTSVVRHLSALRIDYLVAAGRIDEAGWAWRDAGLPVNPSGLLDLDRQSWREMEAICCARLRLLSNSGSLEAARRLAHRSSKVARERGLTRTLLRCLARSMVLEHRAGNADVAVAQLVGYLRSSPGTDFRGPLARERATSRVLLVRLLNTDIEGDIRKTAESLLRHFEEPAGTPAPQFTVRELEVLQCLGRGERDKEIARRLGLTVDGIRYHLKKIYRKTGASSRADAVRRARSLGVLS